MKFSKSKIILICLLVIVILAGGFVFKEFIISDNFPYSCTYISSEGNEKEQEQLMTIENLLKDNNYKYEQIKFQLLNTKDNSVVIKSSEYNKLSKLLGFKEVELKENETLIIPKYDGLKNFKYRKELKEVKKFKVDDIELDVMGIGYKKILVTGLFNSQIVVSDSLYEYLQSSNENKILNVFAYNFEEDDTIKGLFDKLKRNSLFDKNKDFYFLPNVY